MIRETISIDFEFRNSNEKNQTVVCCATVYNNEEKKWWLYNQDSTEFVDYIKDKIDREVIFLAHYSTAEVRCLLNYFEPIYLLNNMKVLDTYVLWKQLEKDPNIAFGIRYENGIRIVSTPPIFDINGNKVLDKTKEYGHYNEENDTVVENKTYYRTSKNKMSKASLVEIVANQLDIDMDSQHKSEMRDLILNNTEYNEDMKWQIMNYCLDDVKYLKPLCNSMLPKFPENSNIVSEQIDVCQWMITSAIIERNGFPVAIDKFNNFCNNVDNLRNDLIEECNKVYTFYIEGKRKYNLYEDYINKLQIVNFPLTKSGKYKADKQTLKDYSAYPELKALWNTVLCISELRYFKNKDSILENIGSDNRCRVMTSPFGTITTRNAPSVKRGWFLAMSTWMRTLVSHKNLWGCDYSAQEILVMAEIAKDKNLKEAYENGDPYSWFAINAKLAPFESNVKKEYPAVRQLCKALMLGLGYGMGSMALANHLTASKVGSLTEKEHQILHLAKKDSSLEAEAEEIMNRIRMIGDDTLIGIPKLNKASTYKDMYYNLFEDVKKYAYTIRNDYKNKGYLKLKNGWTIQHFERATTTSNFEIQGNSAVMMQEACRLAIIHGLEVVATLHDALYIIKNNENDIDILERCMKAASRNIIGNKDIRVESDNYNTDWVNLTSPWVKGRGGDMLTKFGKYFNI